MASWKKVIVSGSQASLAGLSGSALTDGKLVFASGDAGALTSVSGVDANGDGHLDGIFSGSFSGSFEGDGGSLTNLSLDNALTDGNGIADFTYDGSGAASVAVEISGSTLTLGSAGVAVNAGGITTTELADSAVNFAKIQDLSTMTVIGRTASGTGVSSEVSILDEDNMASDSATALATQQSIKAYVDSQVGGSDLDIVGDTGTDAIDLDSETLTFAGGNGIDTVVTAGQVAINGVAGLVSGSGQVVEHLPAGTVSGSAQIRPLFSAVDTTGAAGIDMSYDSSNGQFSGSLVNSAIGITDDASNNVDINLGDDLTVAGGNNITTTATAGQISIALDSQIDNIGATGSFTGSFTGDGSGLTGLATTLNIDVKDNASDSADDVDIDLKTETLTIQGTANEVDAQGSGNIITIGLPQDVTVARDLTVTRDLTVLGDTTTLSTTNLLVEDAFILVASGSTGAVDGGIIVDGGDNNGEGLVYDTDAQTDGRWGFASSLGDGANSADLTAAGTAFAAAVIDMNESHTDIAKYQKAGNIKIDTNEDIYIYS